MTEPHTTGRPWWRLRQVALVAADLDAVEGPIGDALGERVCFRDPGVGVFGLRNALWAVGDTFVEVVSPVRDGTTAGRYLDKRGGDAGYMVILQGDDLAGTRDRLAGEDVRIVFDAVAPGIHGLHLHPRDTGGALVSLDFADDPASWPWAGAAWFAGAPPGQAAAAGRATEIAAVDVACADPRALIGRWAGFLGLDDPGGTTLPLDQGEIRAVPGAVDGVVALDVAAVDRSLTGETVHLCGIELRFV